MKNKKELKYHNPMKGLFSAEFDNEFITGEVGELVNLSKDYPTIKLPISKIPDIPYHSEPEKNFNIMNSSLGYPIIVMVDMDGEVERVLDGNHRIQKSLYLGNNTINAKLIPKKDIKKNFGKSNIQESIRRILREEFSNSNYPIWLLRRTHHIETFLREEMSYLSCNRCFGGFEEFMLNVFRGVYLELSNELDFLTSQDDEYEYDDDEYEYDDDEYDDDEYDDDEPLYNENREIVDDFIEKNYYNLLKTYFDDFCKKCNKKTSIS
jgi:hypothetical protein